MRFTTSLVSIAALAALFTACSGANFSNLSSQNGSLPNVRANHMPVSLVDGWMQAVGQQRLRLDVVLPDKKSAGGIYGSEFYSASDGEGMINGYTNPNNKNGKPTCTIAGYAINGWGVDTVGNLILPANVNSNAEPGVNVFQGPKMCGKNLGTIDVIAGQAADAKSINAAKDNIYVGLIIDSSTSDGAVDICTLKSLGCGAPITNSAITGHGAGVAIDSKGDCWMSAATSSNTGFVMVYWKGCKGKGVVATGTKNSDFGGLFFDTKGNLVSIDVGGMLYVYKGCDPKCTVVSSSKMKGDSIFGNLNAAGNELVAGDVTNSTIDVYKYASTGAKYSYSFNSGLDGTGYTEAGGFDPTNKQL
jgi:hypothetical protein